MQTIIQPKNILELIDINPPYFAFESFAKGDDGSVYSKVPVQQPLGFEQGPISAAEASRHLAILGVCSCALANPVKKRHYYLAYKGVYERIAEPKVKDFSLYAKADCISVDRKKAEAYTELHDEFGTTIAVLRVYYHVILDTTFERLYKQNYIEQPNFKMDNPYQMMHGFKSQSFYDQEMICSMGKVPEYFCAGHFPHYPALPVAILVYNLFHMSCQLCNYISGSESGKYLIKQYEIEADNLAFAGDDVNLLVKQVAELGKNNRELMAEGIANNEKSVGRIHLIVEDKSETKETMFVTQKKSFDI